MDTRKSSTIADVAEAEWRLARARQAFDEGLRDASQAGGRVLRRVVVPAVWGAALLGGALGILLLVRFARRRSATSVLRVVLEQRPAAAPILPAIGGALARFALERMLAGTHESVPNNYSGSQPGADADVPLRSKVALEHGRGDLGAPSGRHADSVVASVASNGGFDAIG